MKKFIVQSVFVLGLLITSGLLYGQNVKECPLKGTAACPVAKCTKKGTADCPYKATLTSQSVNAAKTDCPMKGTMDCPLVQNCPKKGTAACPLVKQVSQSSYAAKKTAVKKQTTTLPPCCQKGI